MRKIIILFFLIPVIALAQKKDYKNFDRAVKYNADGNFDKAIKYANKALVNSLDWRQPNLLLASIYANKNQIELAVDYLLEVYNENDIMDVKGIEQVVKIYYSNGFYNEALFYANKISYHNTSMYSDVNDRYIMNCKFAIEAIKNPVAFNPENLGSHINSENEEYLPAISIDGKRLVFSRRFIKNDILQEDFFISDKNTSNSWSLSEPYGSHLNTNGNEGAFSFSASSHMSVFTACDRVDRIGSCDLYLLIEGKTYNAGKVINSQEWDSQGCFSPDGKFLYFVSSRSGGFGGKDIWRSEITNEGFLKPENMGSKINTKFDEMSPFFHADNLTFYFSSNGHIGMGDYDIYVSRRDDATEMWGGPENIGYPINTYNTENSLVVANDGRTAYYTSNMSGFGLEDIFVFDLPQSMQAIEISDIELDIITHNIGDEIILKNVAFSSNSSEIDSSSFSELDILVAYLIKNPNLNIEIQGHTDDIGNETDNLTLSQNRARAVYEYLLPKINNILIYTGYGESKPLVPNYSENDRGLNRRTSFIIQ